MRRKIYVVPVHARSDAHQLLNISAMPGLSVASSILARHKLLDTGLFVNTFVQ